MTVSLNGSRVTPLVQVTFNSLLHHSYWVFPQPLLSLSHPSPHSSAAVSSKVILLWKSAMASHYPQHKDPSLGGRPCHPSLAVHYCTAMWPGGCRSRWGPPSWSLLQLPPLQASLSLLLLQACFNLAFSREPSWPVLKPVLHLHTLRVPRTFLQ